MPNLARSATGLLLNERWEDIGSWTAEAGWSLARTPMFVALPRSGVVTLAPGAGSDAGGIREGHMYIEDGTWYLWYGAGDGTAGAGGPWRPQLAISTDRGLTWSRQGAWNIGLNKTSTPADGAWAARDMLYLDKRSGKYLMQAMSAGAVTNNVPSQPYESDLFTADSLTGPWTFVRRSVVASASGFDSLDAYAGSPVYHAGTWYLFYSAVQTGSLYSVSYGTSTTPFGPWTKLGSSLAGIPGSPENPKVFWSEALGRWVMLTNGVNTVAGLTDKNYVSISNSITDWSASTWVQTQRPCLSDGNLVVGIASPFYSLGGRVINAHDGSIPITYDTDPTDTNHIGRKLRYTVLRACPGTAAFSPSASSVVFTDNFNRADGAIGNNWTLVEGTAFTISTNKCNVGSAVSSDVMVQTGAGTSVQDGEVQADIECGEANSIGLVYRHTGAAAFYMFDLGRVGAGHTYVTCQLYKKDGTGYVAIGTALTSAAGSWPAGSARTARVTFNGSTHTVFFDGVQLGSVTDTTYSAAGSCGMRNGGGSTGTRLADNFSVTSSSTDTAIRRITRSLSHSNFCAEFAVDYSASAGGDFISLDYRIQGNGDSYRLQVLPGGKLQLQTVVGGTATNIGTVSGTQVTAANMSHRVRVVVSGSTHQAWLDGEQQINHTDASYASGVSVAFAGKGITAKARFLSIMSGSGVSINGVPGGQSATLRGLGGIPLETITTGGNITFSPAHFPAESIEINGTDYPATGFIWGGDAFNMPSVPGFPPRIMSPVTFGSNSEF